ncbi:MAG: hypothetical protein GWN79_11135, partial [Actinobacteria bacterium]|nr:hypothetical protein [Actinomycetota bacterium]NIS31850.1 hypothetical protein [Actinomycetota bacterium]NIU19601.1 hypothetical protein [Actinomycetota bacterium]NIU66941.1 hypothetical protein [Actinomycetota bacterium]NIW28740.1 hypothetical protein [Actinomycetota bacterium]
LVPLFGDAWTIDAVVPDLPGGTHAITYRVEPFGAFFPFNCTGPDFTVNFTIASI